MGILWTKGNIYTMEKEGEKVEAVFTSEGKILGVGKEEDLLHDFGRDVRQVVDLRGKTMLPGFVDSHIHLIGLGESLLRPDLARCGSKREVLQTIKEYASRLEEGEWLIGEGWNENAWSDSREITKEDLDRVVPDRPVLLKRICRHSAVVNSKVLALAGITGETENPPGGEIGKRNGEPTGVLKDAALDLIAPLVPKPSLPFLKRALKLAVQTCRRYGLTGVHTEDLNYYGSFRDTYRAFQEVLQEEEFLFRAHLLVHHGVIDEWHRAGFRYLRGGGNVEFGAMKIFADGSLGSRTALLSGPYKDDPANRGIGVHSLPELKELVRKARELNTAVAIHAIGDLAAEWAIEAMEENPAPEGMRDRLIHAQVLREDLLERLKKLPVVIDVQPRFLLSDYPWVLDRVDRERSPLLYAWKSLLKAGLAVAGGSDAPIEPVNPMEGIYAAVTRALPDRPDEAYDPGERLSVFEAVSLYTSGSARACLREGTRGKIKPGYDADFTILNKNIFEIPPEEILDVEVCGTVIGGKIVYGAEDGIKAGT
ncbi:amidohydrolase [Caldibacillus debilis]|uniref:amidohydrolase n=1 Tax=Caldibacillus debilis TaxID=301148 RepID=UPI00037E3FC8|nr:amidohydrolase [Caldibacillus debilis]